MSDGEGVWAHLVCEQTMLAMGKSFQMGVGCFQMCTVVKKGTVEFSKGHSCQKGHGWVFKWVQLSKQAWLGF